MLTGVLGMGRAQAEARMTETFVFFTESTTVDDDTLETVTVESVLWTGVGRWKLSDTIGSESDPGGQFAVVGRREVHVPVGAVEALPGTLVRCTASTADDGLVGRVVRVSDRHTAGQVTAWRYPVEEITA